MLSLLLQSNNHSLIVSCVFLLRLGKSIHFVLHFLFQIAVRYMCHPVGFLQHVDSDTDYMHAYITSYACHSLGYHHQLSQVQSACQSLCDNFLTVVVHHL